MPVYAVSDEEITAPSAVLMDAGTGTILYDKNAHERRPCASITKVMTLLLVMEAIDAGRISLDDMISASAHAASMGGSDIWLKEGETMSVDDLIKATVVMSANDAAVVLAEYVAGTEDEFVRMMNARALELGMADTVFKNCNGLDEDGHLTSAHDVAVMSRELIKHEKIFDYTLIWMDYVRGGETQLVNTNKLVRSYEGITGLKTGTTSAAGSCISATAQRGDLSLISVVLGCATTADRFSDAATLLDFGFANWTSLKAPVPEIENISVKNAMEPTVEVKAQETEKILIPKGKESEVVYEIQMGEIPTAPVEKGQVLGKVQYLLDGEVVQETDIYAVKAVDRITFLSSFFALLQKLFTF